MNSNVTPGAGRIPTPSMINTRTGNNDQPDHRARRTPSRGIDASRVPNAEAAPHTCRQAAIDLTKSSSRRPPPAGNISPRLPVTESTRRQLLLPATD
jgi:hypothetical protein